MKNPFTTSTPIWIYDKNEKLQFILDPKGEMPYYDAWFNEQLNGAVSLEFTVPSDLPEASLIENDGRAVIRDRDGNLVEFIIRTPEDLDGQNGPEKRVYAEGGDYELIDEWMPGYTAGNVKLESALQAVLTNTRWAVGTVENLGTQSITIEPTTVKNAIIQLIQVYGGELRYRVVAEGNRIVRRYVDIFKQRGTYNGKWFEMGKDIFSIQRTSDSTGIKTALYGYGAAQENDRPRINFADVEWSKANGDPADKPKGQLWVGDTNALVTWGYNGGTRHRFGVYSGQEEDPAELLLNTWRELQKLTTPIETYEIEVALLQDSPGYEHEKVRLGDLVHAVNRRVQPNISIEANIIEYRQNLNDYRQDEVVVGQFRYVFDTVGRIRNTEQIIDNKQGAWDKKETPEGAEEKAKNHAQRAIDEAQERIDQAMLELEDAMLELDDAMDIADDVFTNKIKDPQNYKGYFEGDVGITGELHVLGTIIGGSGAIIRGTLNANNLNLHQANILNANIEDAVITGQLDGVDGTFVGDLVGSTIYANNTAFVGDSLYVTDNLYLGDWRDPRRKRIVFGDGAVITGSYGFLNADLFISAADLTLHSTNPIKIDAFGLETPERETGWCGVGGLGSPDLSGNTVLTGVNFRIKKTYIPSSISYSTVSSNRTPNFIDISEEGFSLTIPSENANSFIWWRGYYTA